MLIIVAAPSRYQLESLALGAEESAVLFPQEQMAAFCSSNHVAFVDMFDAMDTSYAEAANRYFRNDDYLHFSDSGHEVVANFLWPELERFLARLRKEQAAGQPPDG